MVEGGGSLEGIVGEMEDERNVEGFVERKDGKVNIVRCDVRSLSSVT